MGVRVRVGEKGIPCAGIRRETKTLFGSSFYDLRVVLRGALPLSLSLLAYTTYSELQYPGIHAHVFDRI